MTAAPGPARLLLDLARARRVTLATAESCTAGLIAAAITAAPGASEVFDRGFVTYSDASKVEMLGVHRRTLESHGAVSEAVAREMAEGALDRSDAWLAVAVTGIAGPGGSAAKPEGRVCFALLYEGHPPVIETVEFGPIGRHEVRAATVAHALGLMIAALSQP